MTGGEGAEDTLSDNSGVMEQGGSTVGVNARDFIDDNGGLKPGWARAFGAPESFEKKFSSLGAAFGAHANMEGMLGRMDRVPVPNEKSTPEEWDAFYKKAGRPDEPSGYGVAQKPEGLDDSLWDQGRAEAFEQAAHKLGLNTRQVRGLLDWELANVSEAVRKADESREEAKRQVEESLKREWGGAYVENLSAARAAALKLGGERVLNDQYLANHPDFIKIMAQVGKIVGEGRGAMDTREGRSPETSQGIREEIARVTSNPEDPYFKSGHPQHDDRVQYVAGLYAKLYGKGR